ncbi:intersectin-EH binding protein Ibp1 [Mycolicibacterium sediminis]|uniref:Intersectin-EH binding protein Ibp1 n=1 Tax=Mycolicibacterium sediminis TaxID=1286180 RepID=A0A7I7QUS2_9MYCO|nr:intersectin-EH binding protein Ibp1 [Mycolicibacterium sediminis]BBY29727.1 hypothetical protein MSEDJ_38230 [Mycolicibacterium sediminis]
MPRISLPRAMAAAGGSVLLLAAGAILAMPAPPVAADACPPNATKDYRTGVCMPVPPSDVIEETTPVGGGLPEIDGVPCTGQNSYECIGLAEEAEAAGPTAGPTPGRTMTESNTP